VNKRLKNVLAKYHVTTHSGYRKLAEVIQLNYHWKTILSDCMEFTKSCLLCNAMKSSHKSKLGVIGSSPYFPFVGYCWEMDILSGLVSVNGFNQLLVCVEKVSGYCVPIPLRIATSEKIAEALENTIIKNYGVIQVLSSDNASNLQGPEVKRLLKFYDIEQKLTTPYHPQSHGLVESTNKHLATLMRIFSYQFDTNWLNVLTLSTTVLNAMPRIRLMNHSPFFMFFGREPFAHQKVRENVLDTEQIMLDKINDRQFVNLLYQFLLSIRKKHAIAKSKAYDSIPKGSLVYVRDFSKQTHKKCKPVYHFLPQKVLSEYTTLIYTKDIYGRIHKHAKVNCKLASDRSVRLFENLPLKIKYVLGMPMNPELWDKLQTQGVIPEYLQSIHDRVDPVRTRSQKGLDSIMLEENEFLEDDMEFLDSIDTENWYQNLQKFHEQGALVDTGLTIKDIAKPLKEGHVYHEKQNQKKQIDTNTNTEGDYEEEFNNLFKEPEPEKVQKNKQNKIPKILQGIDPTNIIKGKRTKRVRFNLD